MLQKTANRHRGSAMTTRIVQGMFLLGIVASSGALCFWGFGPSCFSSLSPIDTHLRSSSTTASPTNPVEQDELSKYYVDIQSGVPNKGGGDRWSPASDKFYDCAPTVKAQYTVASTPKTSKLYKGQEGEDKYLYQHFFQNAGQQQRPHYFIELGALDGVEFSNSYFYDKELGWGGVLIEGETSNYFKLEQNRGSNAKESKGHAPVKTVHLAICTEPQFIQMSGTGPMAAAGSQGSPGGTRITTVPCIPMRTVLAMTNLPYVDLYSIDVEGAELTVIESHDFDAVPAHTVLIEMRPADENKQLANAKVRRALYARGFCRYDNSVGHNNEVWINSTWVEPTLPTSNAFV